MNSYENQNTWPSARAATIMDKAERFYLRILRALILIIATLLLAYAGWLAASSLYKISQSPDSVLEKDASVSADELTNAQMPTAAGAGSKRNGEGRASPIYRNYYQSFVDRYYRLYRAKFEPYRKQEDKQLSRTEFDGAFLNSAAREQAIRKGELNFEDDRADLDTLLTVMSAAADKERTVARLNRYRNAKKVAVSEKIQKTRTTYQEGWDRTSTACSNWYETPVGCSATQTIEIPYTETVTKMQYPAGTQSQTQIFRAFQDRYFQLLQERRDSNAIEAQQARKTIVAGIEQGHLSLMIALQILGGFLVLMFFFLLIAIERHQRKLAASQPAEAFVPADQA